jgi:outer membrane receptor protein involved in Fe transport
LAHFSSAMKAGPGELRLGIRNLTNKKYFGVTTQADNAGFFWIPEEGRRLSATYTIKW